MSNFEPLFEVSNHDLVALQEDLIIDVTEQIWSRLDHLQLSKTDLARHLGTSKANVTQLLNGGRNMTLRTLASIAYALDARVCFGLVGETNSDDSWEEVGTALMTRCVAAGESVAIESANNEWMDVAAVVPA